MKKWLKIKANDKNKFFLPRMHPWFRSHFLSSPSLIWFFFPRSKCCFFSSAALYNFLSNDKIIQLQILNVKNKPSMLFDFKFESRMIWVFIWHSLAYTLLWNFKMWHVQFNRLQMNLMTFLISFISKHGLFSKDVPNFWWLSIKQSYKISKNPLRIVH